MNKYRAGDKVVIRKDLFLNHVYGNCQWSRRVEYLKEEDYVVIEDIDADGDYIIVMEDKIHWISDEMIECLYGHSNIENEHEIFLRALSKIAFHINEPLGKTENYEDTVYEFIDIAKTALDSHLDYTNNTK